MKLVRMRIAGFKTFVEPTEVRIEPGLTGVVGPNGCGKSNLVEAMRWAMGESSYKSLRASGMDDVIFAGSSSRAGRNMAEVLLVLDNEDRRAPASFNDTDVLEISRKIEREAGSTYRINGREARARDVQLLFADAATGARSPALVRQGQIGELIAAKPEARRRILEDAAGVAGLHTRRHEAEIRLKSAEENLTRLQDIIRENEGQIEGLKRQSRQAARYRAVSADIRQLEAKLQAIAYRQAREQVTSAEEAFAAEGQAFETRTRAQAEAAKNQAVAAHVLPSLRQAEAEAAAGLQRLKLGLHELESEEKRSKARMGELEKRLKEIDADMAREASLQNDAAGAQQRLDQEEAQAAETLEGLMARQEEARALLAQGETGLSEAEAALLVAQGEAASFQAQRTALEQAVRDEEKRLAKAAAERRQVEADLARLEDACRTLPDIEALRRALQEAQAAAAEAETAAQEARGTLDTAREAEARLRGPLQEADKIANRLETEARTLNKLLSSGTGDLWPKAIDSLKVVKGYEIALAAVLGDDLDASLEPSAPVHWAARDGDADDGSLPGAVPALIDYVEAPAPLHRRLRQIGVVSREQGAALCGQLKPGQRLVSVQGDVWRWDGLTAAAEAPSPAAKRLAEKNRLGDVLTEAETARAAAEAVRREAEGLQANVKAAIEREAVALAQVRSTRQALDGRRDQLAKAERQAGDIEGKRLSLRDTFNRVTLAEQEAEQALAARKAAIAALVPSLDLETRLSLAKAEVTTCRATVTQARAALQALVREADLVKARREAIVRERGQWQERLARAAKGLEDFQARKTKATEELERLRAAPDDFLIQRRALLAEIVAAEEKRKAAAEALAKGETALVEADRAARAALEALSAVREARAGCEARLEGARERLAQVTKAIEEQFETTPAALLETTGLAGETVLPILPEIEGSLSGLRQQRESIGPVNLRAETELEEAEGKLSTMAQERDDLTEAISRLRQAISSLNKEGRERLSAAFHVVNGHFQSLFTSLFGGGEAELKLVDSDDPLEAGLEIIARPPGKKPQVMTLLSGGEQALTAIALIFAVFLTNPSPICVLDEVDAPLDDANVERYCDLLQSMAGQTDTRFIVITHNPITMARMDRLYGVTMAERGVSQLVSVDLAGAEELREAG